MTYSPADPAEASPVDPAAVPLARLPRELLTCNGFLLTRLGLSLKAQAMAEFEAAGFVPYHYSVLAVLDEGARETQATIADALRLDRSQLVGLLDTLEERGLVERRRDPNDRRRQMVNLTPAGKRQLATFRKLIERLENEMFAPLDPEERATLNRMLVRLAGSRDAGFLPSLEALSPGS